MAVGQSSVRALSGTYIRVRVGTMRPANCPSDSLIGSYLGIDVAIKEVLPSNEYDVAKYFEREWRLLKYVLILSHFTPNQQCIESLGTPTLSFILDSLVLQNLTVASSSSQNLLRMVNAAFL